MESTALENIDDEDLDDMLYATHAEVKTWEDLTTQRGTPIPTLMNQFYKFIQNPSTVSVETFKRMCDTDDTIGSGVDFLTTCLVARIGPYEHPNPEITAWVNKALAEIAGGFANAIKELLSATWAGFCVQEKVWANDENLGFIIKKLVTLPPTTIMFETERTGELTPDGVLQYQRNYNPANAAYGSFFGFIANGRGSRSDPFARLGDAPFPIRSGSTYSYLSIRIPTLKVVHYAFDAQGKFGNPYGRSLLRRAYKWYVMKDAFLQMLSVALDRKGTPLTIVFADPNTTVGDAEQFVAGQNNKGQKKGKRADVAAAEAFANVHNDSFIVLPGKKDQIYHVEFVPQSSNATDFIAAIDLCNKSLLRALLVPSLIFGNGDGSGSFALGQEHAKTFNILLDSMLGGAKSVLKEQIIKPLLAYNYPVSVWKEEGLGDFAKAELSIEEIGKEMDVYSVAIDKGVIDINDLADLNSVRARIKFAPRTKLIEREEDDSEDDVGDDDDEKSNKDASEKTNDE